MIIKQTKLGSWWLSIVYLRSTWGSTRFKIWFYRIMPDIILHIHMHYFNGLPQGNFRPDAFLRLVKLLPGSNKFHQHIIIWYKLKMIIKPIVNDPKTIKNILRERNCPIFHSANQSIKSNFKTYIKLKYEYQ